MKKKPLFQFCMAAVAGIAFSACDNKKPVLQGEDIKKDPTTLVSNENLSSKPTPNEQLGSVAISNEEIGKNVAPKVEQAPKEESVLNEAAAIRFRINFPKKDPNGKVVMQDGKPVNDFLVIATTVTNTNVEMRGDKFILSAIKGTKESITFNKGSLSNIEGLDEELKLKPLDTNLRFSPEGNITTTAKNLNGSPKYIDNNSGGAAGVAFAINDAAGLPVCESLEGKPKKLPSGPGALQRTKDRQAEEKAKGL